MTESTIEIISYTRRDRLRQFLVDNMSIALRRTFTGNLQAGAGV